MKAARNYTCGEIFNRSGALEMFANSSIAIENELAFGDVAVSGDAGVLEGGKAASGNPIAEMKMALPKKCHFHLLLVRPRR